MGILRVPMVSGKLDSSYVKVDMMVDALLKSNPKDNEHHAWADSLIDSARYNRKSFITLICATSWEQIHYLNERIEKNTQLSLLQAATHFLKMLHIIRNIYIQEGWLEPRFQPAVVK